MKTEQILLFFFSFLFFVSCGEIPADSSSGSSEFAMSADSTGTFSGTPKPSDSAPEKPECEIAGTVLEGNVYWAKTANILVCLAADEETKDAELGDSHRILEIYDGNSCELLEKTVLPIDGSPDYAYTITTPAYNHMNQIVAIKGFSSVYCYNAQNQILSKKLTPEFINERYAEDAQSGMIRRLEVWENYLVGYAQDMGVFVFDLSDNQPVSVEPFAEFEISEGELYNSMFILKSGENSYQIILPTYDFDNDKLVVNALFEEPKNLVTQMNRSFRNNRFIILKENTNSGQTPIAVDMKTMKGVELSDEIKSKKNTEIIDWIRERVRG